MLRSSFIIVKYQTALSEASDDNLLNKIIKALRIYSKEDYLFKTAKFKDIVNEILENYDKDYLINYPNKLICKPEALLWMIKAKIDSIDQSNDLDQDDLLVLVQCIHYGCALDTNWFWDSKYSNQNRLSWFFKDLVTKLSYQQKNLIDELKAYDNWFSLASECHQNLKNYNIKRIFTENRDDEIIIIQNNLQSSMDFIRWVLNSKDNLILTAFKADPYLEFKENERLELQTLASEQKNNQIKLYLFCKSFNIRNYEYFRNEYRNENHDATLFYLYFNFKFENSNELKQAFLNLFKLDFNYLTYLCFRYPYLHINLDHLKPLLSAHDVELSKQRWCFGENNNTNQIFFSNSDPESEKKNTVSFIPCQEREFNPLQGTIIMAACFNLDLSFTLNAIKFMLDNDSNYQYLNEKFNSKSMNDYEDMLMGAMLARSARFNKSSKNYPPNELEKIHLAITDYKKRFSISRFTLFFCAQKDPKLPIDVCNEVGRNLWEIVKII